MSNQAEVQLPQVKIHIGISKNAWISIKGDTELLNLLVKDLHGVCAFPPTALEQEKISSNTFSAPLTEKVYESLWTLINLKPPIFTRNNNLEPSKTQLVFDDFVTAQSYQENFQKVGFNANLAFYSSNYIVEISNVAYEVYRKFLLWFKNCGNLKNYITLEEFRKDFIEKHKEIFDATQSKKSDIRDLLQLIYHSKESSWEYKLEKMLKIANMFSGYPEGSCPDLDSKDIKVFIEELKALGQREICMNLEESEFKKQLLLENSASTEQEFSEKRNAVIKIIDLENPSPDNSKTVVDTKEKKEEVARTAFNSLENDCQSVLSTYISYFEDQKTKEALADTENALVETITKIAFKNISAFDRAKKIYELINESIKERTKNGDISYSKMTDFFCELNYILTKNQPKQADSSSILMDKSVFYVHELTSRTSNVKGFGYFRQEKRSMPVEFPTREGKIVSTKRKADEMKETDALQMDMEVDTDNAQEQKKRRLNENGDKSSHQPKSY